MSSTLFIEPPASQPKSPSRGWPLRLQPADFFCVLLLIALPLSDVVSIPLAGITLNLAEALLPLQIVVLLLLASRPRFFIHKHVVYAGAFLAIEFVFLYLSVMWAHGDSFLVLFRRTAGQAFVFFTYVIFLQSSLRRSPYYLEALVWTGAAVTLVTIATGFHGFSERLDSWIWGRSNALAMTLLMLVIVAYMLVLLYGRWRVVAPAAIMVAGIFLTQSRGSFLVLLTLVGIIWLLYGRYKVILLALVGVAVAGLLVLGLQAALSDAGNDVALFERLATEYDHMQGYIRTGSDVDKRLILGGRLYLWESAVDAIRAQPVFGMRDVVILIPPWVGADYLVVSEDLDAYHNWILNIGARFGLIVLALNFAVLFCALLPYWRTRSIEMKILRVMLLGILAYALVEPFLEFGVFNLNTRTQLYWIIAALGIRLAEGPYRKPLQPRRGRSVRSIAASADGELSAQGHG